MAAHIAHLRAVLVLGPGGVAGAAEAGADSKAGAGAGEAAVTGLFAQRPARSSVTSADSASDAAYEAANAAAGAWASAKWSEERHKAEAVETRRLLQSLVKFGIVERQQLFQSALDLDKVSRNRH